MLESALPALLARVGNGSEKLMEHWLRSHTFAADAARLATDAEVAQLAFNHLIPSDDPAYTEKHWHDAVAPHWMAHFTLGMMVCGLV